MPKLLKQLITISGAFTVIFFIPWDAIFSLELRNDTIAMLMGGTAGFVMLFLFLCFIFIRLMQFNNWVSGIAILALPIALVLIAFVSFLSIFGPAKWYDQSTFRNGNDYLILEGIVYGRDDVITHYRLISTTAPGDEIRHIKVLDTLGTNADRYTGNEIEYNGKKWDKILVEH